MSVRGCFGAALLLVVVQVAVALGLSKSGPDPRMTYPKAYLPEEWVSAPPSFEGWAGRFRRLANYDALHYLSIVEHGYRRSEVPTLETTRSYRDNYAFFPAFPLIARGVKAVTGAGSEIAVLLGSQLMAVVAWLYFLLLLRDLGVERRSSVHAAIFALSFPSAFFFVAGYSESTFVAFALGYAYWYQRAGSPRGGLLAALHGVALSASRPVALPLVIYPLVVEGVRWLRRREGAFVRAGALSVVSTAGYLGYFAYLDRRFGSWRVFFEIQKIGWDNTPMYWAPLNPLTYLPDFSHSSGIVILSQLCLPVFLAWILALAWRLWKRRESDAGLGWGLLFVGASLFYVSIVGRISVGMWSMLRFGLPIHFALVVAAVAGTPAVYDRPRKLVALMGVLGILQLVLMSKHLAGVFIG